MTRIRTLVDKLEQAICDAINDDDVTRQDATDAFAIAMTRLDQDAGWPR